jgi:abequosyltransferase
MTDDSRPSGHRMTLSVAVPSYSRPRDLDYLLATIHAGSRLPDEIVVCDDNSPDRDAIRHVIDRWRQAFAGSTTELRHLQNDVNLGYDRNLQKIVRESASDYVVFIGNDDAFTRDGISCIYDSIAANPGLKAFSRSFVKFADSLDNSSGVSRFATQDRVFDPANSRPRMYLRLSAYFGGLVFDRRWARGKECSAYDGTLYYQLYLFGCAYFETGVGYIYEPVVGARTDGVPLFGVASTEAGAHQPGGYSARARAKMWSDILRIARDIDRSHGAASYDDIHYELKTRLSFHVFESYAHKSVRELLALARELQKLDLMSHPVPITLFVAVLVLRRWSTLLFALSRRIYQR